MRTSFRQVRRAIVMGLLVAACASPAIPAPSSTPLPSISPPPTASPTAPAATPAPSAGPSNPFLHQVVVTVSDRLRVRSQPRVSDDSIMYEPVLPLGTELTVLDGPVSASGYTWYKVAPISFV